MSNGVAIMTSAAASRHNSRWRHHGEITDRPHVIAAPATSGAASPNANLRAFVPMSIIPARRAFHVIATSSTIVATEAAVSQVRATVRQSVAWRPRLPRSAR